MLSSFFFVSFSFYFVLFSFFLLGNVLVSKIFNLFSRVPNLALSTHNMGYVSLGLRANLTIQWEC